MRHDSVMGNSRKTKAKIVKRREKKERMEEIFTYNGN